MRWLVLVVTVLLTLVGLYFSAFNAWLTATPVPDPDARAQHAGVIVAITIFVFVSGIATFGLLSFRDAQKKKAQKEKRLSQ